MSDQFQSCDPFRQSHRRVAAESLLGIYGDLEDHHLFMSIGKVDQWVSVTGSDADSSPPASTDTVLSDTQFWRSVFAHKRIDRSDVSLVVPRYDWTSGVVYTPYSDETQLYGDLDTPFYVLVNEEKVYKCIDNNNGARSTIAPVHTHSSICKLADGYRWKFMYQIPESKRKFLTAARGSGLAYMPVEFVEFLRPSDDRMLQWNIQQDAVDGEIAHIRMNAGIVPFVRTDKCLFADSSNEVVSDVALGATGLTVSSPSLVLNQDYYTDMVLSIDNNAGQGQRRVITGYYPSGVANAAFITVDDPFAFSLSGGAIPSKFSIVPNIRVIGDGSAHENMTNPYSMAAEVAVRFGGTSDNNQRLIETIEIVNGGKDYTFATLDYVAGLVIPSGSVSLNDLATPVLSPPGGHGSNAVKEFGAASLMVVKDFSRGEGGKISTENDFRQIGILLDPLLHEKQVRLSFYQPGLSGSFVVGTTAGQIGVTGEGGMGGMEETLIDAAYGTVVSWRAGESGHSGTGELVLTEIRNGNFAHGATMSGSNLRVFSVSERTEAGSESRKVLRLRIARTDGGIYTGSTFTEGFLAHGVGDYETSLYPSRAVGEIYRWEPLGGSNAFAFLYLEDVAGQFKVGERVVQTNKMYGSADGDIEGLGKIIAAETVVLGDTEVYDQTTSLVLGYNGTDTFDSSTFEQDSFVEFMPVSMESMDSASGYVLEWTPSDSGATGELRLLGAQGTFEEGMMTTYGTDGEFDASLTSVVHTGELKYRSGEILYIQNVKPIQRSPDQKEEIKIVIDF